MEHHSRETDVNIGNANTSEGPAGIIPNPKLKLLDQVSEVMRFKHYSIRTERTYRDWTKRFSPAHSNVRDPLDSFVTIQDQKMRSTMCPPVARNREDWH